MSYGAVYNRLTPGPDIPYREVGGDRVSDGQREQRQSLLTPPAAAAAAWAAEFDKEREKKQKAPSNLSK